MAKVILSHNFKREAKPLLKKYASRTVARLSAEVGRRWSSVTRRRSPRFAQLYVKKQTRA
jgi:hypothetical protein